MCLSGREESSYASVKLLQNGQRDFVIYNMINLTYKPPFLLAALLIGCISLPGQELPSWIKEDGRLTFPEPEYYIGFYKQKISKVNNNSIIKPVTEGHARASLIVSINSQIIRETTLTTREVRGVVSANYSDSIRIVRFFKYNHLIKSYYFYDNKNKTSYSVAFLNKGEFKKHLVRLLNDQIEQINSLLNTNISFNDEGSIDAGLTTIKTVDSLLRDLNDYCGFYYYALDDNYIKYVFEPQLSDLSLQVKQLKSQMTFIIGTSLKETKYDFFKNLVSHASRLNVQYFYFENTSGYFNNYDALCYDVLQFVARKVSENKGFKVICFPKYFRSYFNIACDIIEYKNYDLIRLTLDHYLMGSKTSPYIYEKKFQKGLLGKYISKKNTEVFLDSDLCLNLDETNINSAMIKQIQGFYEGYLNNERIFLNIGATESVFQDIYTFLAVLNMKNQQYEVFVKYYPENKLVEIENLGYGSFIDDDYKTVITAGNESNVWKLNKKR